MTAQRWTHWSYWQRWRIEDAYKTIKRLLELAYFWVGSRNGVALQLWATWLMYAFWVDCADDVADTLALPFNQLSLEMVYRSLYFCTTAFQRVKPMIPLLILIMPNSLASSSANANPIHYHDPHVPSFQHEGMEMVSVTDLDVALSMVDCVVVATDHDAYEWDEIKRKAALVVDTRHVIR